MFMVVSLQKRIRALGRDDESAFPVVGQLLPTLKHITVSLSFVKTHKADDFL